MEAFWSDPRNVQLYYKVNQCTESECTRNFMCPYWHSWVDRRRCGGKEFYLSRVCKHAFVGFHWNNPESCKKGDACRSVHSRTELLYHSNRYKTKDKCREYQNSACTFSIFCAYLHEDNSPKKLLTTTPKQEAPNKLQTGQPIVDVNDTSAFPPLGAAFVGTRKSNEISGKRKTCSNWSGELANKFSNLFLESVGEKFATPPTALHPTPSPSISEFSVSSSPGISGFSSLESLTHQILFPGLNMMSDYESSQSSQSSSARSEHGFSECSIASTRYSWTRSPKSHQSSDSEHSVEPVLSYSEELSTPASGSSPRDSEPRDCAGNNANSSGHVVLPQRPAYPRPTFSGFVSGYFGFNPPTPPTLEPPDSIPENLSEAGGILERRTEQAVAGSSQPQVESDDDSVRILPSPPPKEYDLITLHDSNSGDKEFDGMLASGSDRAVPTLPPKKRIRYPVDASNGTNMNRDNDGKDEPVHSLDMDGSNLNPANGYGTIYNYGMDEASLSSPPSPDDSCKRRDDTFDPYEQTETQDGFNLNPGSPEVLALSQGMKRKRSRLPKYLGLPEKEVLDYSNSDDDADTTNTSTTDSFFNDNNVQLVVW